jgi:hypothetical protein
MLEDRTSVTAHFNLEELWDKRAASTDDDLTAAYMAGLYAGRADKNWVKITDLEISEAHYKCKTHFLFAREIERILMEKNR